MSQIDILGTYKLRVRLTEVSAEQVISLIDSLTGYNKYCYVLEKESSFTNPHLHAYFESVVNKNTIRTKFQRLGLVGNGAYSLKEIEIDPIEYLAYMCKEGIPNWKNGPSEELKKEIETYDKAVKQSMKDKKKSKESIMEQLRQHIAPHVDIIFKKETPQSQPHILHSTIRRMVLDYYVDNELTIRAFSIQSQVDTLFAYFSKLASPSLVDRFTEYLYSSIFRN